MGSRKFQLEKANRYQVLKAVALVVDLIECVEDEQVDGPLELAAEVDNAGEWDDVIVYYPNQPGHTEHAQHWQIKRQTTDISDSRAVTRFGELFKDASDQLNRDRLNCSPGAEPRRRFCLGFAQTSWNVKFSAVSEGPIVALQDLVHACSGLGNPHERIVREGGSNEEQRRWIDFISSVTGTQEQAALVLRHLQIHRLGSEDELSRNAVARLSRWFDTPQEVFESLQQHLSDLNNQARLRQDDLVNIICKFKRKSGSPLWTSLRPTLDRINWGVTGSIPSEDLVSELWMHRSGPRDVRIVHEPSRSTSPLDDALIRLILHRQGGVSARVREQQKHAWLTRVDELTGHTLGLAENDPAENPQFDIASTPPRICEDPRHPKTVQGASFQLQGAMDAHTWSLVCERVDNYISALPSTCNILTDLAMSWCQLKAAALGQERIVSESLARMLQVVFEHSHVNGKARCGPKTAELLGKAVFLALLFSVGYGKSIEFNNLQDAAAFQSGGSKVYVTALRRCAIPGDGVVPIRDVAPRLARKPGVHIFAGTDASSSEVIHSSDADEPWSKIPGAPQTLDAPGIAEVVLTDESAFRKAYVAGKAKLEDFLRQQMQAAALRQRRECQAPVTALQTMESGNAA